MTPLAELFLKAAFVLAVLGYVFSLAALYQDADDSLAEFVALMRYPLAILVVLIFICIFLGV